MGWADTAAEIERLKQLRRDQPLRDGEALALEDEAQNEDNNEEEVNGGGTTNQKQRSQQKGKVQKCRSRQAKRCK